MEFGSWLNKWFLLVFLMSCMMGFVLNYSIILCTAYNSALTTTIVGVLKVGQSVCVSVSLSVSILCTAYNSALTTTIVGILKVGQSVCVHSMHCLQLHPGYHHCGHCHGWSVNLCVRLCPPCVPYVTGP